MLGSISHLFTDALENNVKVINMVVVLLKLTVKSTTNIMLTFFFLYALHPWAGMSEKRLMDLKVYMEKMVL